MNERIRVVLIDDHGLCRRGLAELLERPRGHRSARYDGQRRTRPCACSRRLRPDLAIMDLRMSPTDGFSLLNRVRAEGCTTPVVVLTMSDCAGGPRARVPHGRARLPAEGHGSRRRHRRDPPHGARRGRRGADDGDQARRHAGARRAQEDARVLLQAAHRARAGDPAAPVAAARATSRSRRRSTSATTRSSCTCATSCRSSGSPRASRPRCSRSSTARRWPASDLSGRQERAAEPGRPAPERAPARQPAERRSAAGAGAAARAHPAGRTSRAVRAASTTSPTMISVGARSPACATASASVASVPGDDLLRARGALLHDGGGRVRREPVLDQLRAQHRAARSGPCR